MLCTLAATSRQAYYELQGFIHDQLTTKFHRSVRSVSCTPHVDQVENDSSVNMTCLVRPASLFTAHNLAAVIKQLTGRCGRHDLIVQMALYPGELEAVIAAHGGQAREVSVTYAGAVKAGPSVSFEGSRSGRSCLANIW